MIHQTNLSNHLMEGTPTQTLHVAMARGDERMLDAALKSNVCDINSRNPKAGNATPLIEGVRGGHLGCVHRLIAQGAELDAQDIHGWHFSLLFFVFFSSFSHFRSSVTLFPVALCVLTFI
jgi:hypothetical protein